MRPKCPLIMLTAFILVSVHLARAADEESRQDRLASPGLSFRCSASNRCVSARVARSRLR